MPSYTTVGIPTYHAGTMARLEMRGPNLPCTRNGDQALASTRVDHGTSR